MPNTEINSQESSVSSGWMLFWELVFEADEQLALREQQAKVNETAQQVSI